MKKKSKAKIKAYAEQCLVFAEEVRQEYLNFEVDPKRTVSGLGYIIHEQGDGARPKQGQAVKVNYLGLLVSDGTLFDDSLFQGKHFRFRLGIGEVIAGWDEGIDLLRVGDEATLFIPPKLGYGHSKKGNIPANSELLFYVEVVGLG
ncbi:MAG: FKBP-type peptidyl-prolyl cis-trans isomerase [Bacteroidota bacterium]